MFQDKLEMFKEHWDYNSQWTFQFLSFHDLNYVQEKKNEVVILNHM